MYYHADRHLITIAPSRSGKGTTAIIPTLAGRVGSAIVVDPKGQNAAITSARRRDLGRDVTHLNPFGLHTDKPWELKQDRYNPLRWCDPTSPNFMADVSALAESLIISEGKDPHWPNAARDLVAAIMMFIRIEEGPDATLPRMRFLLTQGPADFEILIEGMSQSSFPPVAQKAARFLRSNNEVQSVISTAITQTSFLDDPAIADCLSDSPFSFTTLKDHDITVYLILPAKYLETYSRWLRLIITSALNDLMSAPAPSGRAPILFLLDEFAQLGHLSAIENAMGMAAGFGVQLWPIVQDLNQLEHLYQARWQTFMANAGVVQVFAPNDMHTATYFSQRCGNRTAVAKSGTSQELTIGQARNWLTGKSAGESETGQPLLSPLALMALPPDKALIFHSGFEYPVIQRRHPYMLDVRWADYLMPDPYHTGAVSRPVSLGFGSFRYVGPYASRRAHNLFSGLVEYGRLAFVYGFGFVLIVCGAIAMMLYSIISPLIIRLDAAVSAFGRFLYARTYPTYRRAARRLRRMRRRTTVFVLRLWR